VALAEGALIGDHSQYEALLQRLSALFAPPPVDREAAAVALSPARSRGRASAAHSHSRLSSMSPAGTPTLRRRGTPARAAPAAQQGLAQSHWLLDPHASVTVSFSVPPFEVSQFGRLGVYLILSHIFG
jgi:hypothetical protein